MTRLCDEVQVSAQRNLEPVQSSENTSSIHPSIHHQYPLYPGQSRGESGAYPLNSRQGYSVQSQVTMYPSIHT